MTPVLGRGVDVAVHLDAGCCLASHPGDDIRLAVAAKQALGTPEQLRHLPPTGERDNCVSDRLALPGHDHGGGHQGVS
jgi:hypothetical protein